MRYSDDIKRLKLILTNVRKKVEIYAASLIVLRNTSTFLRSSSRSYEAERQATSILFIRKDLRSPLTPLYRRNIQVKKVLKTPDIF
jgi:hypothetical protein